MTGSGGGARAEFPRLIRPMLAVLTHEPPADRAAWAAEFKWDGVRAIAYLRGGGVRLMSRTDRELTECYPELTELAALAGRRRMVLDGEIVAFSGGRPSFGALQRRMHVRAPARALVAAVPVSFLAFDLLHLDGRSLLRSPYADRRTTLERLAPAGARVHVPPSFPGAVDDVLAASAERDLEGVVVKRLDSPYLPGRRSRLWQKIKNVHTQDVVIGGWRPGEGRRAGTLGSLLLGVQGPAGLEFCGHVGTGFTEAALGDLLGRLAPLERPASPFATPVPPVYARYAHWVHPALVGEVRFGEWTSDGRLRHPVWRGLRLDADPARVHRELPRRTRHLRRLGAASGSTAGPGSDPGPAPLGVRPGR